MRFKTTVPRTVEQRVISTRVTCDGCGGDADNEPNGWEHNEVNVGAKIGDDYGQDGDCRTVYNVDICAACFKAKVVPALAAIGFVFRERHADDDDRVNDPTRPGKVAP